MDSTSLGDSPRRARAKDPETVLACSDPSHRRSKLTNSSLDSVCRSSIAWSYSNERSDAASADPRSGSFSKQARLNGLIAAWLAPGRVLHDTSRDTRRQIMVPYRENPDRSRRKGCIPSVKASLRLGAMLLAAGSTFGAALAAQAEPAPATPFKVANVHFETNASACDMGAQIKFDTEGITDGSVRNPDGDRIYHFRSSSGMRATGGQTEGFLEGVEPQITELVAALGCAPSEEEGTSSLDDLFEAWPAGDYTFKGHSKDAEFEGQATLTHQIPAGPEIVAPAPGTVVPDAPLLIDWNPVDKPILPSLGPVNIVGYHVIVEEAGAEVTPELDVDLPSTETSVTVPAQYLKPATVYRFEVLSTEESGNQTISEGFFCTVGVADCVVPE